MVYEQSLPTRHGLKIIILSPRTNSVSLPSSNSIFVKRTKYQPSGLAPHQVILLIISFVRQECVSSITAPQDTLRRAWTAFPARTSSADEEGRAVCETVQCGKKSPTKTRVLLTARRSLCAFSAACQPSDNISSVSAAHWWRSKSQRLLK